MTPESGSPDVTIGAPNRVIRGLARGSAGVQDLTGRGNEPILVGVKLNAMNGQQV